MSNIGKWFSITDRESLLAPEDSGLVNERIAFNGWLNDLAEIRGFYAPPFFSDDFRLKIRFNGRPVNARSYRWNPEELIRRGTLPGWSFTSRLLPASDGCGAIMCIEVVNRSQQTATLQVQYEIIGGFGKHVHWDFGKPTRAPFSVGEFKKNIFWLHGQEGGLAVTSSLDLKLMGPLCAGVFNTAEQSVNPGEKFTFYTVFAGGRTAEVSQFVNAVIPVPEQAITAARTHWQKRVERLFELMPVLESDSMELMQLYYRSMLHFLLNEWHIADFHLNPYYSTGSINGGTLCCYLWNYGEPYQMWSMLDPEAAKAHICTYLKLNLAECFAFFPDDGTAYGPYYPVNQEKILLLTHAYVLQTRDVAFLREQINGCSLIEHMVKHSLMHDDLSCPVELVNYGEGNHHLELRRDFRYDGIVPDLNLRRCVNMHLAAELCRIAGFTPPVDLEQRAEELKKLIHVKLYSAKDKWFYGIDKEGNRYLRYTIQMFKLLGWGDWALTKESETGLLEHLGNEAEFLGSCGLHSLSKLDPAYDERDVDNGGPGACISFAPAVIDRLYRCGQQKLAGDILQRLCWLGGSLPYWGDSHRADLKDYRHDTPLQSDIQGAGLAQTIIFGVGGITVARDKIVVAPTLPPHTKYLNLKNIRLAGINFDLSVDATGCQVKLLGKKLTAPAGEAVFIEL